MIKLKEDLEKGSGNVYADLGVPAPERMKRKADLVYKIFELIEQRGIARENAAEIISIPTSELTALLKGQFRLIDESKLLEYINKLQ